MEAPLMKVVVCRFLKAETLAYEETIHEKFTGLLVVLCMPSPLSVRKSQILQVSSIAILSIPVLYEIII